MPSHEILFILCSYLLGAVPFGYLIYLAMEKKDIRTVGSGNIGATNVLRSKGLGAALLTVVLDVGKGVLPVVYGQAHFASPLPVIAGGAAAVLGHMFPVYIKFRGGKGVSPLVGVFLVFQWTALVVFLLVFVTAIALTRYVSLGSLLGVTALFIVVLLTRGSEVVLVVLLLVLLIFFRHRTNIRRLWAGTENTLSFRKQVRHG